MDPVLAAVSIARTALSRTVSATTTKINTLGTKSTVYPPPSVNFFVTFLSPKTFYLHLGHTLDTDFGKSGFYLFKPERLYDRFDFFHVLGFPAN
jgi:hypothetical protein